MNANDFIAYLNLQLAQLTREERTVLVDFKPSFVKGPHNGSVYVNLINLPFARFKQRRGGGAEAENNRLLFGVNGFSSDPNEPVAKVSVEHRVCGIRSLERMRKKTASPEKVADYLANFINNVVFTYAPNFTHE